MIERLVSIHLPEIHDVFTRNNVQAVIYASEWLFGLFSTVIPVEKMGLFFSQFFCDGWLFFYKLVMQFLSQNLSRFLANEDDPYAVFH